MRLYIVLILFCIHFKNTQGSSTLELLPSEHEIDEQSQNIVRQLKQSTGLWYTLQENPAHILHPSFPHQRKLYGKVTLLPRIGFDKLFKPYNQALITFYYSHNKRAIEGKRGIYIAGPATLKDVAPQIFACITGIGLVYYDLVK